MSESNEEARLKVGAHVLVQLGSELVTDVEQAVLECVKNAYDADAPGCEITVDTRASGERDEIGLMSRLGRFDVPSATVKVTVTPVPAPLDDADVPKPEAWCKRTLSYLGSIVIVDHGDGMTSEQLRASWLVISASSKRPKAGSAKKRTDKERTPLGDKGLGRLGTMKLGDILVVETATSEEGQLHAAQFRWTDCETASTVDEIPVSFATLPNKERFKGTRVSILGLNDLADWRRSGRIDEIAISLSKLISPFESISTFPTSVELDGRKRSLLAVTNDVLGGAIASFEFRWGVNKKGDIELVSTARFRKRLLAAKRSISQAKRTELVFERDEGDGFEQWLKSSGKLKGYSRKDIDRNAPWYVELERRESFSSIMVKNGASITDPGPFNGDFYFFHLGRDGDPNSSVAGLEITSTVIKGMTGIAILRDGFRVRSQGDWLGLSSGMTSGSTYGLRVDNTIGYFALTGEFNHMLVEKSDREGFVEDAAYRGFMTIAGRCRKFANDSLELVRRSTDEYARRVQDSAHPELSRPGEPLLVVERNLRNAQGASEFVGKTSRDLGLEIEQLQREITGSQDPIRTSARAFELAKAATSAMDTVRDRLAGEASPDAALQFLRRDIQDRQEQVTALYESAAVGLSARGLIHDLRTHLDEIRQQTVGIEGRVTSGSVGKVAVHLRSIRSSCAAIANLASLIDPMLPRSRMLRQNLDLAVFVREYVNNRSLSLGHEGITMMVDSVPNPASIRANQPRLLQVLDNMVQNSRYWLRRGALTGEVGGAKEINVFVGEHGYLLSDTGPGVDERVEDSLFDIFVSGRPDDGGGQGIGLFIVSQLLAFDGCSISLLPDRNALGRRHCFEVDLAPLLRLSGDPSQGNAK